jgi:hypothetical protein
MQTSKVEQSPNGTTGLDYRTIKDDVASRLRRICAEWSREEFDALVEKVTMTTLKFPPPTTAAG